MSESELLLPFSPSQEKGVEASVNGGGYCTKKVIKPSSNTILK